MYTYKNKTNQQLVLVGIGTIAPEQEFQTSVLIENPNIALIDAGQPAPQPAAPAQPAATPVTNSTLEVQQ